MRFVFQKDIPWICEQLEMEHNQSFGKYRSVSFAFADEDISAWSSIRLITMDNDLQTKNVISSSVFFSFRFALKLENYFSVLECLTVPMSIFRIRTCIIIRKLTLKKVGLGGSIISVGQEKYNESMRDFLRIVFKVLLWCLSLAFLAIYCVYWFYVVDVIRTKKPFSSITLLFVIRLGLRRNSYTQYLIALAIVDSGAILCEGQRTNCDRDKKIRSNLLALMALDELHQYHTPDRRTFIQHTDISCKFYYYVRFIFYSMSSW